MLNGSQQIAGKQSSATVSTYFHNSLWHVATWACQRDVIHMEIFRGNDHAKGLKDYFQQNDGFWGSILVGIDMVSIFFLPSKTKKKRQIPHLWASSSRVLPDGQHLWI